MSTTPSILYLQLDANHDPIFDSGASLTNTNAVSQAILTRLSLFLGEWWENLNLGLPMFQSILGQLGSPQGIAAMSLAVQQNVEGAPFVTALPIVTVSFSDGALSIQVAAQTQFGPVTVNTAPALTSAGLTF